MTDATPTSASGGPPTPAQSESVLQEADRIINGARRTDYGDAYESFDRIARLWSVVLGVPVTPYQVALCMVQLKVARYVAGQQRDSAVDMAGYSGLLDVLWRADPAHVQTTQARSD